MEKKKKGGWGTPIVPMTTRILRTEKRIIDGQEVDVKICPPGGYRGSGVLTTVHPMSSPGRGGWIRHGRSL